MLVLLGIALAVFLLVMDDQPERELVVPDEYVLLGCVCGFLLWIVVAAACVGTSICPTKITDRSITLMGVSEGFIDSVELQRDQLRLEIVDEDEDYDYD